MPKPKLKLERPENPYVRNEQMALRLNEEEMAHLKKMADKFTEGNVSEYVRYAAMKFDPTKK